MLQSPALRLRFSDFVKLPIYIVSIYDCVLFVIFTLMFVFLTYNFKKYLPRSKLFGRALLYLKIVLKISVNTSPHSGASTEINLIYTVSEKTSILLIFVLFYYLKILITKTSLNFIFHCFHCTFDVILNMELSKFLKIFP